MCQVCNCPIYLCGPLALGVVEVKKVAVLFCNAVFVCLIGCSGANQGGQSSVVPPVQASSGYSNANVVGTYAYALTLTASEQTLYGTFTADGSGNITAGMMNVAAVSGNTPPIQCAYTLTGSYQIQTDGSGSATFTPAPSASSPCPNTYFATAAFHLVIAQQGNAVVFAGNQAYIPGVQDNGSAFTAIKQ